LIKALYGFRGLIGAINVGFLLVGIDEPAQLYAILISISKFLFPEKNEISYATFPSFKPNLQTTSLLFGSFVSKI